MRMMKVFRNAWLRRCAARAFPGVALLGAMAGMLLTPGAVHGATFTVNSGNDVNDGVCNVTHCSLREAINAANAAAGTDTINFSIGSGYPVVSPTTALPSITGAVTINGATGGATKVRVDGSNAPTAIWGFGMGGTGIVLSNLIITNFAGAGIQLLASGNTISSNYIGIDDAGNVAGNAWDGIYISAAVTSATITGNVISGNASDGILTYGSGVTIQGNLIGLDPTGQLARGNSGGINLFGTDHTIGGTSGSLRNVISGNVGPGIYGPDSASGHRIRGNYIGLDADGADAVPNTITGVILQGDNNEVGTGTASGRNVISGNGYIGISVLGSGNTIEGNYIGTDATGTLARGNQNNGINLGATAANTVIGGSGVGNVIAGNGSVAIRTHASSTGTVIQGNIVGMDATGMAALGNGSTQAIYAEGSGEVIGGTPSNVRNYIGGHYIGVHLAGSGTVVQGNYIGTDVTGNAPVGNVIGISVAGDGNWIGGTNAGEGNVIAASTVDGVSISGDDTVLIGNKIGVGANGMTPLGNTRGVSVSGTGSYIGLPLPGGGNQIAHNSEEGVRVIGAATNSSITGNRIYLNGELGINLEGLAGVDPNDAGDGDSGPNGLQNYPVLTSVVSAGGTTTINGTLNSAPSTSFTLHFYDNLVGLCDSFGFGEGLTYIGTANVTTDPSGNVSFSVGYAYTMAAGSVITVTATGVASGTSEFSRCNDRDYDTVVDVSDNCIDVQNPLQEHADRNFIDQTPPSTQDDRTVANSDSSGDACDTDDDNDGLADGAEAAGCNGSGALSPTNADTDGDRFLDGAECALSTNPSDAGSRPSLSACAPAGDPDGDKIQSRVEVCHYNTDANDSDTDGDLDGSPAGPTKDGCEVASLNSDRIVNSADQLLLAAALTTPFYIVSFDLNKDGSISSGDQLLMASLVTPSGQCP
jgi:CSLREA domain-containing protein